MAGNTSGARRSRAQWRSLIERAERSPQSVAAFCRDEGISTASFYTWRRRLAPLAASPGAGAPACGEAACSAPAFLDLGPLGTADEGGTQAHWDIELALGAGMVLRLRRG